jgi:hypothetical protein
MTEQNCRTLERPLFFPLLIFWAEGPKNLKEVSDQQFELKLRVQIKSVQILKTGSIEKFSVRHAQIHSKCSFTKWWYGGFGKFFQTFVQFSIDECNCINKQMNKIKK